MVVVVPGPVTPVTRPPPPDALGLQAERAKVVATPAASRMRVRFMVFPWMFKPHVAHA
jgi:hypothetical protein